MPFLTGVLRGGWLFLPLSSMWPYCILSYSWFILCNSFIGLHLLCGRVSVGLHNLICIYCVLASSTAPNCNKSPLKYLSAIFWVKQLWRFTERSVKLGCGCDKPKWSTTRNFFINGIQHKASIIFNVMDASIFTLLADKVI